MIGVTWPSDGITIEIGAVVGVVAGVVPDVCVAAQFVAEWLLLFSACTSTLRPRQSVTLCGWLLPGP